jgi:hypothetical protein
MPDRLTDEDLACIVKYGKSRQQMMLASELILTREAIDLLNECVDSIEANKGVKEAGRLGREFLRKVQA